MCLKKMTGYNIYIYICTNNLSHAMHVMKWLLKEKKGVCGLIFIYLKTIF